MGLLKLSISWQKQRRRLYLPVKIKTNDNLNDRLQRSVRVKATVWEPNVHLSLSLSPPVCFASRQLIAELHRAKRASGAPWVRNFRNLSSR